MLRGHYAYYGMAGNILVLRKVHRAVGYYCRKMLSSPSWKGNGLLDEISADQGSVPSISSEASSRLRSCSSCYTPVNELLKRVVRKICTLHSVGAGDGNRTGHPVGTAAVSLP